MKIRNQLHHRNHPDHFNRSSDCGFSLVELLVVIAIVAILSVSSVLGFGYLGQTLRVRESAGFLSDVVKQEELKVLRGDFDKSVIHFLSDYLVIEEWPTGATLPLSLGAACGSDYKLSIPSMPGVGSLTQKNGEGEVIQITSVADTDAVTETPCFGFKDGKDLEWNFQLTSGGQVSPVLRFLHFNLDRGNPQNANHIVSNANSKIEIVAPYGKKRYYRPDMTNATILLIQIDNADGSASEKVYFQ